MNGTVAQLATTLSAHAWSAECRQLAVCPNNSEIHVYEATPADEPSRWERSAVLREHDQLVCALAWAVGSGKLLSCSHDRNVYVWTPPAARGEAWTPVLSVHHLTRAALCCAWSPCERKFAVGGGSGAVSVCHYEPENSWWVGKLAKRHAESSVLGLAWHPSEPLLATACADGCVRVLAASLRGVDAAPVGDAKFGDVLLLLRPPACGWVHAVAWSPRGDALAFASHAQQLHFVERLDAARAGEWRGAGEGLPAGVQHSTLSLEPHLPCLDLLFLSDRLLLAAGFGAAPLLAARRADGWALAGELCWGPGRAADKKSAFSERLSAFRSQADGREAADELPGVHSNAVTAVRRLPGRQSVSTCGLDGRVAVWSTLAADLGALALQ